MGKLNKNVAILSQRTTTKSKFNPKTKYSYLNPNL